MRNANRIKRSLYRARLLMTIGAYTALGCIQRSVPLDRSDADPVSLVGFESPLYQSPGGAFSSLKLTPGKSAYYKLAKMRLMRLFAKDELWIQIADSPGGSPLAWIPESRLSEYVIAPYLLTENSLGVAGYSVIVGRVPCIVKGASYCKEFFVANYDYAICSATSEYVVFQFLFSKAVAIRPVSKSSTAHCDFLPDQWFFAFDGIVEAIDGFHVTIRNEDDIYSIDLNQRTINRE